MTKRLTFREASERFQYNPETGKLIYRIHPQWSKIKVGDEAGCPDNYGYLVVVVNKRTYKVHRICFLLQSGRWPKYEIDHINGELADNRWVNLREATRSQNAVNQKLSTRNKSGFKGVCKVGNAWWAVVASEYAGCFRSPEAAHAHYLVEMKKRYGAFVRN